MSTAEEKFQKLRGALLALIGVSTLEEVIEMKMTLEIIGGQNPDAKLGIGACLALIETWPEDGQ